MIDLKNGLIIDPTNGTTDAVASVVSGQSDPTESAATNNIRFIAPDRISFWSSDNAGVASQLGFTNGGNGPYDAYRITITGSQHNDGDYTILDPSYTGAVDSITLVEQTITNETAANGVVVAEYWDGSTILTDTGFELMHAGTPNSVIQGEMPSFGDMSEGRGILMIVTGIVTDPERLRIPIGRAPGSTITMSWNNQQHVGLRSETDSTTQGALNPALLTQGERYALVVVYQGHQDFDPVTDYSLAVDSPLPATGVRLLGNVYDSAGDLVQQCIATGTLTGVVVPTLETRARGIAIDRWAGFSFSQLPYNWREGVEWMIANPGVYPGWKNL